MADNDTSEIVGPTTSEDPPETLAAIVQALERNRPPLEVRVQVACKDMDTSLWFPEGKGESQKRLEALAVCRGCPVQTQPSRTPTQSLASTPNLLQF